MTPLETIESRVPGLVVEIHHDSDPHYDFETLGTITYNAHARTVVGVVPKTAEEDAEIARMVRDGQAYGIPVWAYVHSSATVRAADKNPFGCPWDSGRSGWVYVMKDKALKEYGRKLPSRLFGIMVRKRLAEEVEEFDAYLSGQVYGYRVLKNGEEIDSCWNIFGHDNVRDEAKAALAAAVKQHAPVQMAIEFAGDGA